MNDLSMANQEILAPVVKAILRDAASRILAYDPRLANRLNDLAADYAGPYTEETDG